MWLCQKPADLDLQCFSKRKKKCGSAGQGLKSGGWADRGIGTDEEDRDRRGLGQTRRIGTDRVLGQTVG